MDAIPGLADADRPPQGLFIRAFLPFGAAALTARDAWPTVPISDNNEDLTMKAFVIALALAGFGTQFAQAEGLPPEHALYRAIVQADKGLFDAYNSCDLKTFGAMLAPDIEFFHDKGGEMKGRKPMVDAVERNICHKVRRELVVTSLEVHDMANYGAIEIGRHTFCNLQETPVCKPETNGEARFVHLWKKEGDHYVLARALSFDHVSRH
jgi:ketosteroid isomerase-like protein